MAPTPIDIGPGSLCYELCESYPRNKPCPPSTPKCVCNTPASRYCCCFGNPDNTACHVGLCPTNKPTKKPTNKPTKKLTNKPTNKPTKEPTKQPSKQKLYLVEM
jgi:hypothetical protein